MTRWIGSLLIAAVSSVVTLLLAWSSLGPPTAKDGAVRGEAAVSADDSSADDQSVSRNNSTSEVLQELAMLDDEQSGQPGGAPTNSVPRSSKSSNDREGEHWGTAAPRTPPMTPRNRLEY